MEPIRLRYPSSSSAALHFIEELQEPILFIRGTAINARLKAIYVILAMRNTNSQAATNVDKATVELLDELVGQSSASEEVSGHANTFCSSMSAMVSPLAITR
jgi:hypothetical protein